MSSCALHFDYHLETNADEVRSWYNGYTSGSVTVYNPWSIINLAKQNGVLQPYWINTSSNDIIKSLITEGNGSIEEDIEALIARKSITKDLCENVVYGDIEKNSDALWNFLFLSGYLTFKNSRLIDNMPKIDFLIPNEEVAYFFRSTNSFMDQGTSRSTGIQLYCGALKFCIFRCVKALAVRS